MIDHSEECLVSEVRLGDTGDGVWRRGSVRRRGNRGANVCAGEEFGSSLDLRLTQCGCG